MTYRIKMNSIELNQIWKMIKKCGRVRTYVHADLHISTRFEFRNQSERGKKFTVQRAEITVAAYSLKSVIRRNLDSHYC